MASDLHGVNLPPTNVFIRTFAVLHPVFLSVFPISTKIGPLKKITGQIVKPQKRSICKFSEKMPDLIFRFSNGSQLGAVIMTKSFSLMTFLFMIVSRGNGETTWW